MSSRIKRLKQRALSGKPESIQAVKDLCATSDLSIEVLPTLLRFLSQHRPPLTDSNNSSVDDTLPMPSEIGVVLEVFGAIAAGITSSSTTENAATLTLRKFRFSIHLWSTFFVQSYVESDLDATVNGGGLRRTACNVVRTILMMYSPLLVEGIIRPQEIRDVQGAGDLFVRLHIYALLVQSSVSQATEVCHLSSSMIGAFTRDWEDVWTDVFNLVIEDFDPRLVSTIARILSRITQQRPPNYSMLHNWFRILASVASTYTFGFIQPLLQHRSVYFTTHLIRHISKILSHPENGPISLQNADIIRTWKRSVQYLFRILTNYDCCKSLVLALNSGLLEALWRLSQVVVQNSCPPGAGPGFSFQELFGALVGIIATASLYRSVQKPLERLLNKSPLNEISERIADTSNHKATEVQRIWGRFRTIVENRIQLRYRWEGKKSFCSNIECQASPETKLFRCSSCMVASYCGRLCQKFDWIQKHRKKCLLHTIAGKHPSGFWVNVEERDLEILDNIIHTELWHIRSELLQQQCDHLKSPGVHDSQASTTLFNFIDFTSPDQELEKKIWTRFEAERNTPSFNWDLTIQSFKKTEQENGSRVGPYVIVKIPYLGGRMMLHPLILTKPDVRIDSGDSEDDDEDENTNSNTEPLDFDLD